MITTIISIIIAPFLPGWLNGAKEIRHDAFLYFLIVSAPTTSAVASNLIVDGKSATDLLALAGNYIPTTYLDAKGIFTAILVAIGCVEIMHFMFKKRHSY